jgi:hypothetical protein
VAPHKKQEHLTPEAMHYEHGIKRANARIAEMAAKTVSRHHRDDRDAA